MKPLKHVIASIPLGGVLFALSKDPGSTITAMVISILVDLDHIPDYLFWRKRKASIKDFLQVHFEHRTPYLIFFLHSWEFLFLCALLFWHFLGPLWAQALILGWLFHLLCDQIFNPVGFDFYFFTIRASKGFQRKKLL